MVNSDFIIGKLYVYSDYSWNSSYEKEYKRLNDNISFHMAPMLGQRGDLEQFFNVKEPFLILEKLYIAATKVKSIQNAEFLTYNKWQVKILVNENIGWLSIWDYEFSELM